MADPTPPRRPSWRGGDAARPRDAKRSSWQQAPRTAAPGYERSNLWRRIRLAALAILSIGMVAAVIWALLPAPSKVHLVLLGVAEGYDFPLPPNAWVRDDLARLAELTRSFRTEDLSTQLAAADNAADWTPATLARRLAEPLARDRGRRRPAILYVSAHGAVRQPAGQREACLIPPGLSADEVIDDGRWLSVEQLVTALAAEPALQNRLTLLVLDVGKLGEPWPLGIFDATFYGALAAAERGLAQPQGGHLWLLTSSADAQSAWTSAALGGSAFGHYLHRALSGEADREGNANRRITADELQNYLVRHVDAWARANRAARQTPRWITPGASDRDLAAALLVELDRSASESAAKPFSPEAGTFKELDDLWRQTQPAAGRATCYAPALWQELLRRLLWTEQLAQAGPGFADLARESALVCRRRWEELQKLFPGPDDAPDSLAAWRLSARSEGADAVWRRWESLALTESPASAANLRQALTSFVSEVKPPRPAAECVFASHLVQQLDRITWSHEATVRQALASVARREELAAEFPRRGAAVPGDPRVAVWIQGPLAEHDQTLRAALDALLVGAAAQRAEAARGLSRAATEFEALQQRGNQIAAAFALCDEIWSQAPYLAAWHARRVAPDAAWPAEFRPLAQQADELARSLYDRGPASAPIDEIRQRAAQLAPRWTAFHDPFDKECEALRPQAAGAAIEARVKPERMRRLLATLDVPQLKAESRVELRRESWDLDRTLQAEFARSMLSDASPSDGPPAVPAREVPVLALWSIAGFTPSATDPVLAGAQFREALVALTRGPRGWSGAMAESDGSLRGGASLTDAFDDDRQAAAEREARLLAPAVPTPQTASQVVGRQMLLRAAARSAHAASWRMDDFWGPGPSPFFAEAAAGRLHEARSRLGSAPLRLGDAEIERLLPAVRLGELRQRAESPLVSLKDSRIEDSLGATTPVALALRPATEGMRDPQGVVALRVVVGSRDGAEPLGLWREGQPDQGDLGMGFALDSATQARLAVSSEALRGRGEPRAAAWFRGFVTEHSLGTPSTSQRAITIVYPRAESAAVRVDGSLKKRAQVMFVFDCSGSMRTRLPDGKMRLDAAWTALTSTVSELARREQFDVGLRQYAHRYDFGRKGGGYDTSVVVDTRLPNRPAVANKQLQQPATDTEVVHRMQRLNRGDAQRFGAAPPNATGVTPLYYSILESLKYDFLDRDEPKFLVVLTDGADGVYRLGSETLTASASLDDVAQELSRTGVQLHVVGFAVEGDEDRRKWDGFRRWLAQHEGQTYDATNPQELALALNKALGLNDFTITDTADSGRSFREALGRSVTIPLADCGRQRNWTAATESRGRAMASEPFVLLGGEYLRLEVDDADERIVFRRFDARGDDEEIGPAPETKGWRFGCWRDLPRVQARVQADLATFFVWMQQEDLQADRALFSPRPEIVWIEITPYSDDRRQAMADRYVFYDAPFVLQEEVPIVEAGAPNWPRGCEMAKVELWVRGAAPTPSLRLPLRELPPDRTMPLDVAGEGLEGVSLSVSVQRDGQGVGRVTIVENWTNPPEGFRPLAIQIEPPPPEVRHSYGDGNRTAKHEFMYGRVESGWLLDKELTVTTFDRIRNGAATTPAPLWVPAKSPP